MRINTIADVLQESDKDISSFTVDGNMMINDVMNKMIVENINHTIFVVDANKKVIGSLSARHVAQHIFCNHISPSTSIFPFLDIMDYLTKKYAKDIMDTEFISCTKDDKLDDVSLKLCTVQNVFESIPVVDNEMQIIASIHILSLIKRHLELSGN